MDMNPLEAMQESAFKLGGHSALNVCSLLGLDSTECLQ